MGDILGILCFFFLISYFWLWITTCQLRSNKLVRSGRAMASALAPAATAPPTRCRTNRLDWSPRLIQGWIWEKDILWYDLGSLSGWREMRGNHTDDQQCAADGLSIFIWELLGWWADVCFLIWSWQWSGWPGSSLRRCPCCCSTAASSQKAARWRDVARKLPPWRRWRWRAMRSCATWVNTPWPIWRLRCSRRGLCDRSRSRPAQWLWETKLASCCVLRDSVATRMATVLQDKLEED